MNAEELISDAIPERHRQLRIALRRLLHACENTTDKVNGVISNLAYFIDDPVEGLFSRVLVDNALELSDTLHALANEVTKSAATLNASRQLWQEIGVADEGRKSPDRNVGLGESRPAVDPEDDDIPF